jgi:hypothetical protein
LLSLTVSLKFIGLATGDSVSPFNPNIVAGGFAGKFALITATSGNVLLPVVLGGLLLNKGVVFPAVKVAPLFQAPPAAVKSHCS